MHKPLGDRTVLAAGAAYAPPDASAVPVQLVTGFEFDISVVIPFADDEERIGLAVRRVAEALRAAGRTFEIIAVDEHSGDNSHAVLALMRGEVPQLRVVHAPARGRAVETGVARAAGHVVLLTAASCAATAVATPQDAATPLMSTVSCVEAMLAAVDRIRAGACDAEVALGAYTALHHQRAAFAVRGVKANTQSMHRRVLRRLQLARIAVVVQGAAVAAPRRRLSFALGRR